MKNMARFGTATLLATALVLGTSTAASASTSEYYSSPSACTSAQNAMLKKGYVFTRTCYNNQSQYTVWMGFAPISWMFDYKWIGM